MNLNGFYFKLQDEDDDTVYLASKLTDGECHAVQWVDEKNNEIRTVKYLSSIVNYNVDEKKWIVLSSKSLSKEQKYIKGSNTAMYSLTNDFMLEIYNLTTYEKTIESMNEPKSIYEYRTFDINLIKKDGLLEKDFNFGNNVKPEDVQYLIFWNDEKIGFGFNYGDSEYIKQLQELYIDSDNRIIDPNQKINEVDINAFF